MKNFQIVDSITYIDPAEATRQDGSLISWQAIDNGSDYTGYKASGMSWNIGSAAKMCAKFTTSATGTLKLYVKAKLINGVNQIWINIDGNSSIIGEYGVGRIKLGDGSASSEYEWLSDGTTFTLNPGSHTIEIYSITDNIEIQRLAIAELSDTRLLDNSFVAPDSICTGVADDDMQSFGQWQNDDTRNTCRTVLVEVEHGGGTIRFASKPYIDSDTQNHYDDYIIGSGIYLEEAQNVSGISLGDISLYYPTDDINLDYLSARGYPITIYYGDETWPKSQYKIIGTATIDSIDSTGPNQWIISLVPNTDIFNRTFSTNTEDTTRNETFKTAVDWLLDQHAGSPTVRWINVDAEQFTTAVKYVYNDQTTMAELLVKLCTSINAKYRFSQTGQLEIYIVDRNNSPALELNSNNVVAGSTSNAGTTNPVKHVKVIYADEQSVTVENETDTGVFAESVTITSVLLHESDAKALAEKIADTYIQKRIIYQLSVVDANSIQVGSYLRLLTLQIAGDGVVTQIRRTPLSSATELDVIV